MFGLDLVSIIKVAGYVGITAMVFAESGLLLGFFLPGDSLLFTAGFLASQGVFKIGALIALTFLSAVAGDQTGYFFGKRVGRKLFRREDSIFFHKDHLLRAESFYAKYGKKTIIIARFLPIVRTFVPILAGVGQMYYPSFLVFDLIGGVLWAIGLPLAGYYLGNAIPNVDHYLLPIILFIIIISFSPAAIHLARHAEDRRRVFGIVRHVAQKLTRIKKTP